MADRLVIKDGNLDQGLASLRAAKSDFDQVQDRAGEAADACGYKGLADVLRTSSSDWSLRRGKLSEALERLAGHLQNTKDAFEQLDEKMAEGFTGTGDSQPASDSSTPSAGASSTPTPQSKEPVTPPPSLGPEAAPTGSGSLSGEMTDSRASQQPSDVPVEPTPLGQTVDQVADSEAVGSANADGDGVAVAGSGASGAPSPRTEGAEDLIASIVERWSALGGETKAAVSVLALAGLGLLAKNIAGGVTAPDVVQGDASSSPDRRSSHADTTEKGHRRPLGHPSWSEGEGGADSDVGDVVSVDVFGADDRLPGAELEADIAAPVQESIATSDPSLDAVPGVPTSQAATPQASGSDAAVPAGSSSLPAPPPSMPDLEATPAVANAVGETGFTALPALRATTLPNEPAAGEVPNSMPLPSLQESTSAASSAPMATGIPLSTGMLRQSPTPITPSVGTPLPNLGAAGQSPSVAHRASSIDADRHAERILDELSRARGNEDR